MIGQNQSKIDAYEVELRLEIKSKNLWKYLLIV